MIFEPGSPAPDPPSGRTLHVGRPNLPPRAEFDALVDGIYERGWVTNDGPLVRQLERRIADRVGVEHCVAMSNGTVALEIAIRASGMTGEVIVPSFTFVATAHALLWQGLTPVFADVDPNTHNLDPDQVEALITPRTTGIIAVHLWGRAAPVRPLQAIADRHGLALLFDAAHAFDCSHQGRPIGGFGLGEVFSFHATKFFNTIEGGAIVTNDALMANRARLMRNFGFAGFDNVIYPGTNGKMNEFSAAMGLANLERLDEVVRLNRDTYDRYRSGLGGLQGIEVLAPHAGEDHNYQYVVALVGPAACVTRDEILEALHSHGVLARRYFWPGVHRMEPYASLDPGLAARLPMTENIAAQVLVLPAGPSATADDVDFVCGIIRSSAQPAQQ